tara:strand:- start:891 stop:1934 length:1044 start_codon:yes stop_codon:yes gene_type:complete
MENYLLTEDDIKLLNQSNAIKNTMAVAGDVATPEELNVLFPSGNMPAQQNRNIVQNQNAIMSATPMPNPNSLEVRNVDPRVEPPVPLPVDLAGMGLLDTQVTDDPFDNLSKTQRRMLAFAGIRDAGLALQGKEGNSVNNLMTQFAKRADINRKAQAVAAQRQAMANLSSLDRSNPEAYRAEVMRLLSLNVIDGPTANIMLQDAERTSQRQRDVISSTVMLDQIDALLFDPALDQALGLEGFLRRTAADLNLDPDTARVKGRLDQVIGKAFLEAYKTLKGGGQITELEGNKAQAAEARLSTAQRPEDFREALREYRFYIEQGVKRLQGEDIPPDTLYERSNDPIGIFP